MQEWNGAAQKCLRTWAERSDFEGALVSGSYAVGLPDTHSDIDIMIVLSDHVRFWERGNANIGGFLIEYLANPSYFWERTFNGEYAAGKKVSINIFAIGKILTAAPPQRPSGPPAGSRCPDQSP